LPVGGRCSIMLVEEYSSVHMTDTLNQAIAAIKAGDRATGQRLPVEVLCADPRNDMAWIWMSVVVSIDQRRECLERALAISPNNEAAAIGWTFARRRRWFVADEWGKRELA
jgi:hypothetical protein